MPSCTTVSAHCPSVCLGLSLTVVSGTYGRLRVYVCKSLHAWVCFPISFSHRSLFQHHWASQLSQHKGRWETSWEEKGKKSGAAAKAAGCVSFPPLSKSDRAKDTDKFTDCESENKKRHALHQYSLYFWRIWRPLSLYSIPIKICFYPIISSSETNLNESSLVRSFEDGILGRGTPGDQRPAAPQFKCSASLFILADDVSDKKLGDVEEGGIEGCCSKRYGFPSSVQYTHSFPQKKCRSTD